MANQYSRGSEWRRWELHLHTPYTKKEDQYHGSTPEEKWDNFYNTIHEYVGDGTDPLKAVCAIAITDYLSIENYITVRDHHRLPSCVKLLLPNVELRLKPIAQNTPINIHCIFSPDLANEINDRFFAKLIFEYNGNRYAATRSQLISFGRAYSGNNSLPPDEACQTALSQYVISLETLSSVFKDDPELRKNTIIVVSNKSTDGASGTHAHSEYFEGNISQLDATRRSIYQLSDMIYSANPTDIDYFLGRRVDDEATIKHKCGSLMPCIHGCDAHTNEKIFEPNSRRYCWIKADPTFEGFKQILYEPKERVRISSTYPETKQNYHVIDRIEIIGNSNFDPQPLFLNENLTCIIGGKSTGKSLILHNLAFAIDSDQVRDKEKIAVTNVKQVQHFKAYWRDGACSYDIKTPRKIVYIPQTYLNRLSDEKEETTEIDTIIQEIVLQDENASQQHKELNRKVSAHKQVLTRTVVDFVQTIQNRDTMISSKMEIGDKSGILKEISLLSTQLEQLSKEYNVTEDEMKTYQSSIEKVQQQNTDINAFIIEKETIESITSVLQMSDLSQKGIFRYAENMSAAIERTQVIADSHWLTERKQLTEELDKLISEIQISKACYQKSIDELKPKMEGNEQIVRVSKAIASEREKLEKISEFETKLNQIQRTYGEQISILVNAFSTFKEFYTTFADNVNDHFPPSTEDLKFRINCVFRSEQFLQKLLNIINNKTIGRFQTINLNKITEEDLEPDNLRLFIESIMKNSTETVQLTKGHSFESTLRDLFTDWYNIDYVVTMDGDHIEDMSPGKKALVLLRLLISLAESKCPILIDQPEDDLDNRSIFDELIQFIKDKKVDRQIIVATHNANIVLGGDAELVLIANQGGKNSPNKAYRFEYRGGSIENNTPVYDEQGNICNGILNAKGIQTHICEILEGGERAFDLRKNKYRFFKQ